jgi:hypothetical protein
MSLLTPTFLFSTNEIKSGKQNFDYRIVHLFFKNTSPSMHNLSTGSFFTDIYGLKFCVQFLHCDHVFWDVTQRVLLVS